MQDSSIAPTGSKTVSARRCSAFQHRQQGKATDSSRNSRTGKPIVWSRDGNNRLTMMPRKVICRGAPGVSTSGSGAGGNARSDRGWIRGPVCGKS
jgi:hypothetical protein